MTPIDPLAIAALVASILEEQGIRYVIGGSVASSLIGEPRTTLDLDVIMKSSRLDFERLFESARGEGLRELLLRAARDSGIALSNHGS